MRDTLHAMELVDRYLDGTLPPDDRAAFELRAADSLELRQLIEDQRALREGMHRLALRKVAADSGPSGGKGWFGTAITTVVVVVVGATVAWLYWPPSDPHEMEPPVVQEEQMIEAPGEDVVPCDADSTAPAVQEQATPIIRADTHVVVKTISVPAHVTEEQRAAIIDSLAAINGATEVIDASTLTLPLQNVLTPNNDGRNDRLIVPGGPYRQARMEVRNAAHQIVFDKEGPDPIWNGMLSSGKPAPEGIYYCNVEATDHTGKTYRGYTTVQLVRSDDGASKHAK